MATIRDPAFWKRFSTAVHLNDVEAGSKTGPKRVNTDDSWLARQQKKKNKRALIIWGFWAGMLSLCGAVVIVVIILANQGLFTKLGEKMGTSSAPPNN